MMVDTYAWESKSLNINYFKMNTDVNRSGCVDVHVGAMKQGVPGPKTQNKYISVGPEDLLQPSPLVPISRLQEIKEKVQKSM